MAKLRMFSTLLATALVGAAFAQTRTPPPDTPDTQSTPPASSQRTPPPTEGSSAEPESASSPHQREATRQPGTESMPTQGGDDPASASSPHQRGAVGASPQPGAGMKGAANIVGYEVESEQGETLGAVIDVTMDASGEPEYVVISTGRDTATAVPYETVSTMIQEDRIVMDRTKLQNSPQVAQNEVQDRSNTKWRTEADRYWGTGTMRSATPGRGTEDETIRR